jgi:uncharacterized membrane protein
MIDLLKSLWTLAFYEKPDTNNARALQNYCRFMLLLAGVGIFIGLSLVVMGIWIALNLTVSR